ncbi:hypothetical protein C7H19_25265 [Aphanothece hegewaldii CCALA 016]|uniref:Uncharacterized protein n=1 Tax=Aphanothece hegewaldii CCALA 016 TaxID=2107694 RepID=A0A2T1LQ84_9CHRO|nr:hypothetical protein [Aphanothece hegewaldii]PSF25356.1 hypothetical protein C7H19_25265 [Aphanothece hegewaldii CCALA 016]
MNNLSLSSTYEEQVSSILQKNRSKLIRIPLTFGQWFYIIAALAFFEECLNNQESKAELEPLTEGLINILCSIEPELKTLNIKLVMESILEREEP